MEQQSTNNVNSRRNNRRKSKNKNRIRLLFLILIITAIIIVCININKNSLTTKIKGTWTIDGNTTYEFNDKNKGVLITSVARYEFKYSIKDKKLNIDFENEKAKDATFEISIENDKLTLTGVENTKGTYSLIKK